MDSAPAVAPAPAPQGPDPKRLVLKNTVVLLTGQLIGAPLNMAVTAVMAQYLGPAFYGSIFLITARTTVGWLFAEWGQGAVVSGEIARDHSRAGELLGTTLVWRVLASLLMYGILAASFALDPSSPPHAQLI